MSEEAGAPPADPPTNEPTATEPPPQEQEDDDGEEYKQLAENYKNQGNEAFKTGRYAEAATSYGQAIDLDPDNHVLYSNRSAAYLKINERGKALKDGEKCMELKPDWPKSYSRKGAAQHALTRYEAAMDTYRAGLKLFPEDAALKEGLKAAQEGYETDKKARFEKGKREREEQAKRKERELEEAAKAKAAAAAAAAAQEPAKPAEPEDELAGFFEDIGSAEDKPKPAAAKPEKSLSEAYSNADLGTSEEQIERLLQPSYQWKNLNPFFVLQLGTDATDEDIKLRYRKLSTLVHPDKNLSIEKAREAFEEVKKAYQQLMDADRRKTVVATIEICTKRAIKERKIKIGKGASAAEVGTEEDYTKKAIMKEFAEIEMRRRNTEKHEHAYRQYEQKLEDEEKKKIKKEYEFEKSWSQEERHEGRVASWRDFQTGPGPKRAKVQAWKAEENIKEKPKFGQAVMEEWKKDWK